MPGAAGDGFQFTSPPALVRFGEWAAITAGGLILFVLLVVRGRRRAQEGFVNHSAVAVASTSDSQSSDAKVPSRTLRRDEENMPRWLRPSVQAARQGRFTDE